MEITKLKDGFYSVRPKSKYTVQKEYFVDLSDQSCDCDDFLFRKEPLRQKGFNVHCKHIKACIQLEKQAKDKTT